jgi:hypothetical protein
MRKVKVPNHVKEVIEEVKKLRGLKWRH